MADQGPLTEEQAFRGALAALVTAVENLIAALDKIPDPQDAFNRLTQAADEFTAEARKLTSTFGAKRAQQVQRIWEAEELTLTELGDRIGGVTKQRARKLLLDAKKLAEDLDIEEGQP
jgi:hypothetical protein